MGIELLIVIIIVFLICTYNVLYYIPNKLREQDEKQALYIKELYIRLNVLEDKLDKLIEISKGL